VCLEQRSTIAAERGAETASFQADLAAASLVLGVVGTIALLINLKEARKTTAAGIAAASEAKRANDLSKEITDSETRPWLALRKWNSHRIYNTGRTDFGPPDGQAFNIEWRNGGVSTALIKARGEEMQLIRRDDPPVQFGTVKLYDGLGALGPGDVMVTPDQIVKDRDYEDFREGNLAIFIRCIVVYAHPKHPETDFRSEFTMRFLVSGQKREGELLVPNLLGAQFGTDNVFT
jgi:hypothetical protein